jgi:hypothetical protein
LTLKTGSLGMIVIGFCYLALARDGAGAQVSSREQLAVSLCSYGLIADLVAAGAGYVICTRFWPNFFSQPVPAGKNVWLAGQSICTAVYVLGVVFAFIGIRHASQRVIKR